MNEITQSAIYLAGTDWNMHGDMGSGWGIIMLIGMILFWSLVVVFAIWLLRGGGNPNATASETPLEILKQRLAQGEISIEEYDRLRDKLASSR